MRQQTSWCSSNNDYKGYEQDSAECQKRAKVITEELDYVVKLFSK